MTVDDARRSLVTMMVAACAVTVLTVGAAGLLLRHVREVWQLTSPTIGGLLLSLALLDVVLARFLLGELRRRGAAEAATGAARQAAHASDAKFRVYFENLADGAVVIRVEPDGSFVYAEVNRAAETILGVPATSMVGREPYEIWSPDHARATKQALSRCVEQGKPITYIEHRECKGDRRELRVALAPVRSVEGRTTLILKSVRDMTDAAREAEELRQSQRFEAIGQLASGIAHDFNNLLQAQMGSLELLLSQLGGQVSAEHHARTAIRMGERGAKLTHRLLAYSRKQLLEPRPVELSRFLTVADQKLSRALGPRIASRFDIGPGQVCAYVDPAQLENALLHLALNARDAMPQGGFLRLKAFAASAAPSSLPARGYVVIAITDTGRGMTETELTRACEPFFTTKGPHVSGLGLPMVLGFARQSGGDLLIRSAPGRGTRVEIWLPHAPSAVPAVRAAPAQATTQADPCPAASERSDTA